MLAQLDRRIARRSQRGHGRVRLAQLEQRSASLLELERLEASLLQLRGGVLGTTQLVKGDANLPQPPRLMPGPAKLGGSVARPNELREGVLRLGRLGGIVAGLEHLLAIEARALELDGRVAAFTQVRDSEQLRRASVCRARLGAQSIDHSGSVEQLRLRVEVGLWNELHFWLWLQANLEL